MEKYKKSYTKTIYLKHQLQREFELPDGSYSVSVIQDCFEYLIKKATYNLPIKIYVNKIENRITSRTNKRSYP